MGLKFGLCKWSVYCQLVSRQLAQFTLRSKDRWDDKIKSSSATSKSKSREESQIHDKTDERRDFRLDWWHDIVDRDLKANLEKCTFDTFEPRFKFWTLTNVKAFVKYYELVVFPFFRTLIDSTFIFELPFYKTNHFWLIIPD